MPPSKQNPSASAQEIAETEQKFQIGDQWYYRGNRSPEWLYLQDGRKSSSIAARVPEECWPILEEVARLSAITAAVAQKGDLEKARELLIHYTTAIDAIYNHNEASRAACVQHFGTCHPVEVWDIIGIDPLTRKPFFDPPDPANFVCSECGKMPILCDCLASSSVLPAAAVAQRDEILKDAKETIARLTFLKDRLVEACAANKVEADCFAARADVLRSDAEKANTGHFLDAVAIARSYSTAFEALVKIRDCGDSTEHKIAREALEDLSGRVKGNANAPAEMPENMICLKSPRVSMAESEGSDSPAQSSLDSDETVRPSSGAAIDAATCFSEGPEKSLLVDGQGRFTCPKCSRTHRRGPLNGESVYRCLYCGTMTNVTRKTKSFL